MADPVSFWIVIADGERARILVPTGRQGTYRTERKLDSPAAHSRSRDLGSDTPGRSFESATPVRHAITPRSDLHQQAKQRFLAEVAKSVNEAAENGSFERLVLIAPTHAMSTLRHSLSPAAARRMAGLLRKDLTKTPDADIGSHLTWDVFHPAGGL